MRGSGAVEVFNTKRILPHGPVRRRDVAAARPRSPAAETNPEVLSSRRPTSQGRSPAALASSIAPRRVKTLTGEPMGGVGGAMDAPGLFFGVPTARGEGWGCDGRRVFFGGTSRGGGKLSTRSPAQQQASHYFLDSFAPP